MNTDAGTVKGRKNSLLAVLVIYAAVFFAAWSGFELLLKPRMDSAISNEMVAQFVKSGVIKNLVWTLPALLLPIALHMFYDLIVMMFV